MASVTRQRKYDFVLLGATGYTGKLCAEHITNHLPTDLNWAIAGRSEHKLLDLLINLRNLNPDRKQPGMTFHCDAQYKLELKLLLQRSK